MLLTPGRRADGQGNQFDLELGEEGFFLMSIAENHIWRIQIRYAVKRVINPGKSDPGWLNPKMMFAWKWNLYFFF